MLRNALANLGSFFGMLLIGFLVVAVAAGPAEARKRGKRDYRETLAEGINRKTGNREVTFSVHSGKRNQGLKAEGMDRFGISEFPQFGGRAPRPSVIQPDLEGRTGGGRGRHRRSSYSEPGDDADYGSCNGGY